MQIIVRVRVINFEIEILLFGTCYNGVYRCEHEVGSSRKLAVFENVVYPLIYIFCKRQRIRNSR